MNIIKPTANQISLTTANNIYSSQVVFVSAINAAVITLATSAGTTIATFTLPANQYIYVQKNPTDTLAANVAVYATAASYRG
jgi:hypothetical protein